MSTLTERQHGRYFLEDLEHHLRETLEAFGAALYAQAEACREELAFALVDAGRHMTASIDALSARLRRTGPAVDLGMGEAAADTGSGVRRLPAGVTGQVSATASQHRVPGSHVEISYTMRGYEFIRPEPAPEDQVPEEGRHPRDSKVA